VAGGCDVAESCDGVSNDCPADVLEPATTECRADAGQCDVAEDCTGSDPDCPANGFEPNGTGCDDADACTPVDQWQDGVCLGSGSLCGNGTVEEACGEECDLPDDTACSAVEACNDDCLCQSFIGDHKCVVDPNSSFLRIITVALPLSPFPASGAIDILCGFEDPNTGKSPCDCELQFLDPINLIGIGYICFTPGDPNDPCSTGEIDCDGGNPLDVSMDSDHNIGACTDNPDCSSQCDAHCAGIAPTYAQFNSGCGGFCTGGVRDNLPCTDDSDCPSGSCTGKDSTPHGNVCLCDCVEVGGLASGAGGLQCNLGANIDVEINPPCGDGDVLIAVGTRCIPLTTEAVTSQIHNANNSPGDFPVPPFTSIGTGIPCSTLATSTTTGLQVVGSVNFFDSTIGDLQSQIMFSCL
jgi:hypothetical protein